MLPVADADAGPAFRELCLRCRRPKVVCWCDALRPVPSQTHVVFIQHPREARVPVSTCRMAHLSLPNSELHIGLGAVGNPRLEALCREEGVAVLFPSEGATQVSALTTPPRTLVVVDGTWSNAKKVVEKCPLLSRLPRLAFTPEKPGNYRIRKEPAEHCLATIEATAYVLEALEHAPARFTPMLHAFDHMVERQLDYIGSTGNHSRHKQVKKRNSPRFDPLGELKDKAGHLVAVFGEANAWPLDAVDRPAGEAELLQLVAERLDTGERFTALLKPSRPLSPSVSFHLDLPDTALLEAQSRADALTQWRAFVRPGDLLVGWGRFCFDLLTVEGAPPEASYDLRRGLTQLGPRRPGSVEACAARLGVSLPDGQGRAMRRLVSLAASARAVLGRGPDAVLPPV